MSATTHAVSAYAITALLLWGYALTLWMSARRRQAINRRNTAEDNTDNNPGTIRGGNAQS
jgi:Flp pilus assembly protein TadB